MRKPNLAGAASDDLVAWIKYNIRQSHGDGAENKSIVYARSGGWFNMTLFIEDYPQGLPVGPYQRKDIPKFIDLIKSLAPKKKEKK